MEFSLTACRGGVHGGLHYTWGKYSSYCHCFHIKMLLLKESATVTVIIMVNSNCLLLSYTLRLTICTLHFSCWYFSYVRDR